MGRMVKAVWEYLKEVFDNRITMAAGIVFVLILAMVIFNTTSHLQLRYPIFGVFSYGAVVVLFIAGGIIFFWALWRS
jgi:hypothetical protein